MIMFWGACYPIYYYKGKDWDFSTSNDKADLHEKMSGDDSEDYDESMADTDVYDGEGLGEKSPQGSSSLLSSVMSGNSAGGGSPEGRAT